MWAIEASSGPKAVYRVGCDHFEPGYTTCFVAVHIEHFICIRQVALNVTFPQNVNSEEKFINLISHEHRIKFFSLPLKFFQYHIK